MDFWGWINRRNKISNYFLGVGVGLVIAWVTGGLAYFKGPEPYTLPDLIILELVVSIIMFITAYLIDIEKGPHKKRK